VAIKAEWMNKQAAIKAEDRVGWRQRKRTARLWWKQIEEKKAARDATALGGVRQPE